MGESGISSIVRNQLELLSRQVSGDMLAVRMWRELMSEIDRRALLRLVNQEPRKPELDDNPNSTSFTQKQELLDGSPGKLFDRCYFRWGAVGMWAKARSVSRSRAIVELAFEYQLLNEASSRRLLRAIGEAESPTTHRPIWDRATGKLSYSNSLIREIKNLGKATNIVAILDALEELGWPSRIDDPLPGGLDGQRLREAVKTLNRGLKLIRFRGDGTSSGIVWDKVDTPVTPSSRP